MITVTNSPRPRIEQLLSDVGRLKGKVQNLERDYQDCARISQDAERDLQNALWPLRRAESDNAQKDSSFDGRQAMQYIDSSRRDLEQNQRQFPAIGNDSRGASGDFDTARRDLAAIIQDSSAYPSSLTSLRQAEASLQTADQDHDRADGEGNWANNRTQQGLSDLRWAESSARNVSYDRPGQDVSNDARQASRQVDRTQWQTRDASTNLRNANSYEQRSESGLSSVEQQLRQALAALG
jgi:chromosome segregation ATPase